MEGICNSTVPPSKSGFQLCIKASLRIVYHPYALQVCSYTQTVIESCEPSIRIARPASIIEQFEAETVNYVSAASGPSPTLVVSQDARLAENVGAAADTTGTSTVAPDSHGGCSR